MSWIFVVIKSTTSAASGCPTGTFTPPLGDSLQLPLLKRSTHSDDQFFWIFFVIKSTTSAASGCPAGTFTPPLGDSLQLPLLKRSTHVKVRDFGGEMAVSAAYWIGGIFFVHLDQSSSLGLCVDWFQKIPLEDFPILEKTVAKELETFQTLGGLISLQFHCWWIL